MSAPERTGVPARETSALGNGRAAEPPCAQVSSYQRFIAQQTLPDWLKSEPDAARDRRISKYPRTQKNRAMEVFVHVTVVID